MENEKPMKNAKGHFLPGNKFWMARSSHGPNFKFENPDDLWKACCEYFEWNDSNPLFEDTVRSFEGDHVHVPVAKMRAMTIIGLCMFIDITMETWSDWRKNRPDLADVIKKAEAVIKKQKFEGASAGMLKENIIARDLGMADKMQNQMQMLDSEGKPTDPDNGVKDMLAAVLAKVEGGDAEA